MILEELRREGLIDVPDFVVDGLVYLTVTGSTSYGISTESSDVDLVGICVPPIDYLFPCLRGDVEGFVESGPQFSM